MPELNLVPFTPDHFETLSGWFTSQADAVRWGGPMVNHPLDHRQLTAMVEEGRVDPPTRCCWMAVESGAFVGHAQLGFDWRNGVARLGRVGIAPAERGRGLAVPMLRLVLDEAFARQGIERAELHVYPWNTTAIRSYQTLGFVT